MTQIGASVILQESSLIDSRWQAGTYQAHWTATSKTTGKTVSEGSGETDAKARKQLRRGFLHAGWTHQEVTDLLADYDKPISAERDYPKVPSATTL